jgi:hypothetical protein
MRIQQQQASLSCNCGNDHCTAQAAGLTVGSLDPGCTGCSEALAEACAHTEARGERHLPKPQGVNANFLPKDGEGDHQVNQEPVHRNTSAQQRRNTGALTMPRTHTVEGGVWTARAPHTSLKEASNNNNRERHTAVVALRNITVAWSKLPA